MTSPSQSTFSWRSIVVVTLFLLAFVAFGSCLLSIRPLSLHRVPPDKVPLEGLPADADQVSYAYGPLYPAMHFEFDASEASFLEWVATYTNAKIVAERPIHINRYNYSKDPQHDPNVTITNGHHYEWSEGDMGQRLVYDKDKGRAYVVYRFR